VASKTAAAPADARGDHSLLSNFTKVLTMRAEVAGISQLSPRCADAASAPWRDDRVERVLGGGEDATA